MTSSVSRRVPATFRPLAVALSVSAVFSSSSFAQTSTDQQLESVVVTATRTPQKAGDVLSDTVVISAEQIAQSGQTSLVDLLQQQRGVEIARNGGAGTTASVFLRGSNSNQVVLLIDGVRSASSTTGQPIWSTVPLSDIDHIEIVLGPLATMYGADAVGGVIQVFTKKGSGAPHLSFSVGAGTYGEQVETASVSGSTGGGHAVRYSLNASHEKADGFSATLPSAGPFSYDPDKDGYEKKSIGGQFSWNLAKGHEIGFSFLNSHNEAQFDTGPSFDARDTSDVNTYSVYSRNQLTSAWSSLLQLSRSYSNDHSVASYGTSTIDSRQDLISWQNDFKLNADQLQVILEHRKEEVSSTDIGPTPDRTTDSVALAYQHREGAHLVSASVRNDDNSDYGNHTTASAGYGYSFTNALRFAASYGTSFRAPTYNELFYPGFGVPTNKPEKGRNAEIGLHYDDGKSTFDAVYYHNRVSDLLINASAAECPPGYTFGCAKNVEDALLEGVSLAAGTKLGSGFSLRGSLDLQNPRDETTDKLLDRRARQHGTIGLDYAEGPFAFGADIVYSSYRMDDETRLGGYTLLNLHATYALGGHWQLFGRWNNVFDKFYELAEGYQTPGSNVFVGVRYGFN
jgi:vitamin B12 transporter